MALVGCLVTDLVWGQANVGVITGTVVDGTGAVIPGTTVTVINEEQGTRRSTATQEDGTYLIPNMHPGRYTIVAERQGFKRYQVSGLRLDVGGRLIHAIPL
jgi:hypothetical protein